MWLLLAAAVGGAACARDKKQETPAEPSHTETNAVYYWKTVFDPDSAEIAFLRDHRVGRVYLRLFDVVENRGATPGEETVVPNASVVDKALKHGSDSLSSALLNRTEFVPVVYITLDALKAMEGKEGELAEKIVLRAKNMCSYNEIPNVKELQLDCDWTSSTEPSYFRLCDEVKAKIKNHKLHWGLSSTIRLHQLRREPPRVDRGVLMVYNTGSFDNPRARNSIIDEEDVKPYLKYLDKYPLPLDVAYPAYSWQLLFRGPRFAGIMSGLDTSDTTLFAPGPDNAFIVRQDFPYRDRVIYEGDVLRDEKSDIAEILRVKRGIEKELAGKPHSNIIYHLDSRNLSNYTDNEIDSLYAKSAR